MSSFYQYKCKDCAALFFVEWESTKQNTQPYCPSCNHDDKTELTGAVIEKGQVTNNG